MKIEKSELIINLMNLKKNPHTNNIVNCRLDVIINKLVQADSIECVFSKKSYLPSKLETKELVYPTNKFAFYQLKDKPEGAI
jgi:hypothetical protein